MKNQDSLKTKLNDPLTIRDETMPHTTAERALSTEARSGSLVSGLSHQPREDRYQMLQTLGEGGMGIVSAVHDHILNREVAQKFLKPGAPLMLQELFVREAQTLAALQHPNIPPIYDLVIPPDTGEERALSFTMEKVNGDSLGELIRSFHQSDSADAEPLFHRLLEILIMLAEAVNYAHQRGLLHRDLKPENVMVGEHGEVRVLDWGLSGVVHEDDGSSTSQVDPPLISTPLTGPTTPSSTLKTTIVSLDNRPKVNADQSRPPSIPIDDTLDMGSHPPQVAQEGDASATEVTPLEGFTFTGKISGTPGYMSPEQARGEVLTRQSDVYSLGAILWEILSGYPPLVRERLGESDLAWRLVEASQSRVAPQPIERTHCPHPHLINHHLIEISEQATHLDLNQRYERLDSFIQALRDYHTGYSRRGRVSQLRREVKARFKEWQEFPTLSREADDLWDRFKLMQSQSRYSYLFSLIIQGLKELAQIDKSDSDARFWGVQVRYKLLTSLWERAELTSAIYQNIKKTLLQRVQSLLVLKSSSLGRGIPWDEVSALTTSTRAVKFVIPPHLTAQSRSLRGELYPLTKLNIVDDLSKSEDATPIAVITADQTLDLEWGYYRLEVYHGPPQDPIHFSQLVRVPLPHLEQLGASEMTNRDDREVTQEPSQRDRALVIEVTMDSAPPLPNLPSVNMLGGSDLVLPSDGIKAEEFRWIGEYEVTLGTPLPLPNTLGLHQAHIRGMWVQASQLTTGSYIRFLSALSQLADALPPLERDVARRDIERCIPDQALMFDELMDIRLLRWIEPHQFEISPEMKTYGYSLDCPISWMSFMDIKRYLLWLTWDTGIPWALLSESEWELCARGVDKRLFPWGDLDVRHVSLNLDSLQKDSTKPLDLSQLSLLSKMEQSYPHDRSPFGVFGLGGGLSDWTISDDDVEAERAQSHVWLNARPDTDASVEEWARALFNAHQWRETFKASLSIKTDRSKYILRGGSFVNQVTHYTTTYRFLARPIKRYIDAGFRLVYRPPLNERVDI